MRAAIAQHGRSELPASVIEQRTALRRQLVKFRRLQAIYQPELAAVVTSPDDDVMDAPSRLPSSLPPSVRASCSPKLVSMEKELRLGQCQDALESLRLHLHSRSRILKDKFVNVRHQGPNTKSRELLNRVSARISACADKYRAARSALDALDPDPMASWRHEFLLLQAKDVRGMSEPKLPDHPDPERARVIQARMLLGGGVFPEGNQTLSWIWRGAATEPEGVTGYNEGLPAFPLPSSFNNFVQHIDLNGRKLVLDASAGVKRSSSSRKKCDVPSSSSNGDPQTGQLRPPHLCSRSHPLPRSFSRVLLLTPFDRLKSSPPSTTTSRHYGAVSRLRSPRTINHQSFPHKSKMKCKVLTVEISSFGVLAPSPPRTSLSRILMPIHD